MTLFRYRMDGTYVEESSYLVFHAEGEDIFRAFDVHPMHLFHKLPRYVDDAGCMDDEYFCTGSILEQRDKAPGIRDISCCITDVIKQLLRVAGQDEASDFGTGLKQQTNDGPPEMAVGSGDDVDPFHVEHLLENMDTVLIIFHICIIIHCMVTDNRQLWPGCRVTGHMWPAVSDIGQITG